MYQTRIGHAHLFVRELERSMAFYTEYLNLKVTEQQAGRYAFLTSGAAHHELGLSARGPDAPTPAPGSIGLFHLAFDVADKRSFALAYQKLTGDGIAVSPVDHKIGWGLYFADPDGNGLEIYCDTREQPDGAALWSGQDRVLDDARILAALNS